MNPHLAFPYCLFQDHSNIILLCMPRFYNWSVFFRLTLHSHVCHMPNPSNFLWFDSNSKLFGLSTNNEAPHYEIFSVLRYLHFMPGCCVSPPYSQHPLKSVFPPQCETPSSTPTQNSRQAYCFVYFNVTYSLQCLSFIEASCEAISCRRFEGL